MSIVDPSYYFESTYGVRTETVDALSSLRSIIDTAGGTFRDTPFLDYMSVITKREPPSTQWFIEGQTPEGYNILKAPWNAVVPYEHYDRTEDYPAHHTAGFRSGNNIYIEIAGNNPILLTPFDYLVVLSRKRGRYGRGYKTIVPEKYMIVRPELHPYLTWVMSLQTSVNPLEFIHLCKLYPCVAYGADREWKMRTEPVNWHLPVPLRIPQGYLYSVPSVSPDPQKAVPVSLPSIIGTYTADAVFIHTDATAGDPQLIKKQTLITQLLTEITAYTYLKEASNTAEFSQIQDLEYLENYLSSILNNFTKRDTNALVTPAGVVMDPPAVWPDLENYNYEILVPEICDDKEIIENEFGEVLTYTVIQGGKQYRFYPRKVRSGFNAHSYSVSFTKQEQQSLYLAFLKGAQVLAWNISKMAAAVAKARDPLADYEATPWSEDASSNVFLVYNEKLSAQSGQPVFTNIATNSSISWNNLPESAKNIVAPLIPKKYFDQVPEILHDMERTIFTPSGFLSLRDLRKFNLTEDKNDYTGLIAIAALAGAYAVSQNI